MAVTSYSRTKFYPEGVGRCWGPCPGESEESLPDKPYQVRWFVFASTDSPGVSIRQSADLDISSPWVPRIVGQDPQNALIAESWVRYCKLAINYSGKEFITVWENKGDSNVVRLFWNDGSDQEDTWTGETPMPFYNGLLQSDGTKEVVVFYLKTATDATKIYMRRESDSFASETEFQTLNRNIAKILEVDTGVDGANRTTFSMWLQDEDGQLIELESDGYTGQQSANNYWYSPPCGSHKDYSTLNVSFSSIGYDGFVDASTVSVTFSAIVHTIGVIDSGGPHTDESTLSATFASITHSEVIVSETLDADISTLASTLSGITYTETVFESSLDADVSTLTATFGSITYSEVIEDSGGPHTDVSSLSATFSQITYLAPL